MNENTSFSTKFGVIATAAGSAIGLGNIWRFPYLLGENGGGAFLLVYIIITIVLGIPLLMTEFAVGKKGASDVIGSFRRLCPKGGFGFVGIFSIISVCCIVPFYVLLGGWTLAFLYFAVSNKFVGFSTQDVALHFDAFVNQETLPIAFMVIFVGVVSAIVMGGVANGIERFNKILMPMFVFILIILCINSLLLPGIGPALQFMFRPNFSLITPKTLLKALGQALFSLSIGQGAMLIYGAYMRKEDDIRKTSLYVAAADLSVAILAGLAIFPGVFSYGVKPSTGSNLVFITLPRIFSQMVGGYCLGILFFSLLFIAALTSVLPFFEVLIASTIRLLGIRRGAAAVCIGLVSVIASVFCALSLIENSAYCFCGESLFNLLDRISSDYLLPISALVIVLFVGWKLPYDIFCDEIPPANQCFFMNHAFYMFVIKFLAPLVLVFVLLGGLGIL